MAIPSTALLPGLSRELVTTYHAEYTITTRSRDVPTKMEWIDLVHVTRPAVTFIVARCHKNCCALYTHGSS